MTKDIEKNILDKCRNSSKVEITFYEKVTKS